MLEPERTPGPPARSRASQLLEALYPPVTEVAERAAGRRRAQGRGAEPGGLLGDVRLVARGEQGEEIARVRGVVGAKPGPRIAALEDGGDGEGGAVVHGGCAAEPDGLAGEPGKRRIALGVDLLAGSQQRGERQLVEDDHDDGARGLGVRGQLAERQRPFRRRALRRRVRLRRRTPESRLPPRRPQLQPPRGAQGRPARSTGDSRSADPEPGAAVGLSRVRGRQTPETRTRSAQA